jgi:hypothetical protein
MSVIAIADDENMKTSEGTRKIIEGGYTILASYGFDGNYFKSRWRRMHTHFHYNNMIRKNDRENPLYIMSVGTPSWYT